MRLAHGPGQGRAAEAPRRSFRPEARGARALPAVIPGNQDSNARSGCDAKPARRPIEQHRASDGAAR